MIEPRRCSVNYQPPSLELCKGAYNPAIIPLTNRWRSMLISRYPNAEYLVAFKFVHAEMQCDRLALGGFSMPSDEVTRMNVCGTSKSGKWKPCLPTAFALLDKHFGFVTNVTTGRHRPERPGHHPRPSGMHPDTLPSETRRFYMESRAEDVRLHTLTDARALLCMLLTLVH